MTLRRTAAASIAVALAILGCGPEGGSGSASERNGSGPDGAALDAVLAPVCADCTPQAGGETSDFEGDEDAFCGGFIQRRPVTYAEAAELGFDVAEIEAIAAQPIVMPFAWRPFADFIPGDRSWDVGGAPTGYQSDTSISLSVALGAVQHLQYDPERCDAAGACSSLGTTQQCVFNGRSWLRIEAMLTLKVADRSIEAEVPVVLSAGGDPALSTSFEFDLSGVYGTLRLSPTRPRPYTGTLSGYLRLSSAGAEGNIVPALSGIMEPSPREWLHRPLEGHFPADEPCGFFGTPADPSTAAGRAVIEEVDRLYARLRPLINEARQAVRWVGPSATGAPQPGGATTLRVTLGDTARVACVPAGDSLAISTDALFETEDGNLSWSVEAEGRIWPNGERGLEMGVGARRFLSADDPFWSVNLGAVTLLGSSVGEVSLVTSMNEGGGLDGTQFNVFGVPDCALDPSCTTPGVACDACGRRLIVAGLTER